MGSFWLNLLFSVIPIEEMLQPDFYEFLQFAVENKRFEQIVHILVRFENTKELTDLFIKLAINRKWAVVEWLLAQHPKLWSVAVNDRGQNILFIAIDQRNLAFLEKCKDDPLGKDIFSREDGEHRNSLDYLLKKFPYWIDGIRLFSQVKVKIKRKYLEGAFKNNIRAKNSAAFPALLNLAAEERRNGTLQVFPLHMALRENSFYMAQELIRFGEDVKAVDDKGNTVLHISIIKQDGHAETLIRMGANVNAQNKLGNTPLHYAASQTIWSDHTEMTDIPLLLRRGGRASLEIKNNEGQTPLHLAAKTGNLLAVNSLENLTDLIQIKDHEGKTPVALAVEHHQFHLLYSLLHNSSLMGTYLVEMESFLPGKVLYRVGRREHYRLFQKPKGEWLSFILNREIPDWILLIPFLFHDVHFAHKLFEYISDEQFARNMRYLKEQFPPSLSSWLETERELVRLRLEIHPEIYRTLPSIQIPPAPAYANFAYAKRALTGMIARIQDKNPRKEGFTKTRVAKIEDQLNTFILGIERKNLSESMTGKKGTPECTQFYRTLENMFIRIALFLSKEDCPVRILMQEERAKEGQPALPLLDDDYCASAIGELAKSTKMCAIGRADALFVAYGILNDRIQGSSSSSDARSWEKDVHLHMDGYREQVVQRVIGMQKEKDGGEISRAMEAHIGHQVRSLLKNRGVQDSHLSERDNHTLRHITAESVQHSFDQFFSLSGLFQMMEEGVNGVKGANGKFVQKPVFDSGKMLDWLRDNTSTPQELHRQGLCNELVVALELKQKEKAMAIAEKLGVASTITRNEALTLADELRTRVVKDFHFNEETGEWGKLGIVKMMMHPKIGIFRAKEEGKRNEEEKREN